MTRSPDGELQARLVSRSPNGDNHSVRELKALELARSAGWQDHARTAPNGDTYIDCGHCGKEIHTDGVVVVADGTDAWCEGCFTLAGK